jgi:hypothetical protein
LKYAVLKRSAAGFAAICIIMPAIISIEPENLNCVEANAGSGGGK